MERNEKSLYFAPKSHEKTVDDNREQRCRHLDYPDE